MIYALNYIGAIPYPMQPTIPNAYLDKIMNENEIKNLFIFNGFYEKFENELKENIEDGIDFNLDESKKAMEEEALVDEAELEDGYMEEEDDLEDSDELFEELDDVGEEDLFDSDLADDNLDNDNDII